MKEKEESGAGKVGMDAFNVVAMSNDGVKMFLYLPDGTKTDEFLIIRGADSKTFRNHQSRANREKVQLSKRNYKKGQEPDPAQMARQTEEIDRRLVATLIADWSFDTECTEENVVKFFSDAPQVQTQVDVFAGDRSNFFKKPPQD